MPRYFVDLVHPGHVSSDEEGMELPDMAAVRNEVETTIREIAAESVRRGDGIGDGEIQVRDANGGRLLTVKFRDVVR
jgi:hypothetical protein